MLKIEILHCNGHKRSCDNLSRTPIFKEIKLNYKKKPIPLFQNVMTDGQANKQ